MTELTFTRLCNSRAIIRKCNNALHPDLYGHYREAKFTQTKHHWWWKANRVFDQLDVTRHHTGLVLFLEEDHYVAEDFLHLLALMERRAAELCTKCNILSLGTYLKTFNYFTYNSNHKVSMERVMLLLTMIIVTRTNKKQFTNHHLHQSAIPEFESQTISKSIQSSNSSKNSSNTRHSRQHTCQIKCIY